MNALAIGSRRIDLVQADITTLDVDAIVNAANAALAGGGGVDGAIHRRGGPSIMAETRKRYPSGIRSGDAVASTAGDLQARYVIHAVAPIYRGDARDAEVLSSAYRNALTVAAGLNLCSVAFPSLGTGAYGYPIGEAAAVALRTVVDELLGAAGSIGLVTFALFSQRDLDVYAGALAREGARLRQ